MIEKIDRKLDLQLANQLVELAAQLAGIGRDLGSVLPDQVVGGNGDDQAVDGNVAAILAHQPQEREPLLAIRGVLIAVRPAARGVQENRFLGKEPVTIARTSGAGGLGNAQRKVQAGVLDRRRLSRRRLADDQVPGEEVYGAAAAAGLGPPELLQPLLPALVQVLESGAIAGLHSGHLRVGLLIHGALKGAVAPQGETLAQHGVSDGAEKREPDQGEQEPERNDPGNPGDQEKQQYPG